MALTVAYAILHARLGIVFMHHSAIFFKFIIALCIASLCLLVTMQYDPWLMARIQTHLRAHFNALGACTATGTVKSINIFTATLEIEDISVTPQDPHDTSWSWSCKKCTIHASWWSFFKNGIFTTTVSMRELNILSTLDLATYTLSIEPHVRLLVQAPAVFPIAITMLSVRKGTCTLLDPKHGYTAHMQFDTCIQLYGSLLKSTLSLYTSTITTPFENLAITNIKGHISTALSLAPHKDPDLRGTLELSGEVPLLCTQQQQQAFCLTGLWKDNQGIFELSDHMHAIVAHMNITKTQDCCITQYKGTLPLSLFSRAGILPSSDIYGTIHFSGMADLYDLTTSAQITLTCTDLMYKHSAFPQLTLTALRDPDGYRGTLTAQQSNTVLLKSTWHLETAKLFLSLQASNPSVLLVGNQYTLQPGDFSLQAGTNFTTVLEGTYTLTCTHCQENQVSASLSSTGTLTGSPTLYTLKGTLDDLTYIFQRTPHEYVCTSTNSTEEHSSSGRYSQNCLQATIDYQLIKKIGFIVSNQEITGEGTVHINATVMHTGTVEGTITLTDASIRIPYLYNAITAASGAFTITRDSNTSLIELHTIDVSLYRGTLKIPAITLLFDAYGQLSFMCAPFLLHQCFISWHKDFLALISGAGIFKYHAGQSSLNGSCIIEQAHLKGNIFGNESPISWGSLPSHVLNSCALNIHVASRYLSTIKTEFLHAHTQVRAEIKGTLGEPQVQGNIELTQGSLEFPYKPLLISTSTIRILPSQLDDPLLDIHAKNTVKNFTITLSITGSFKTPKVLFDASPHLSEEQIITLLIAGCEEGVLSAIVPSALLHNLPQLLLGPPENPSKIYTYLKTLLKRFKNIRITPMIDNNQKQEIRAGLEIDINDRLRGSIKKNFSIPEESKIELDYALSDEIILKGIKDEHGDLGAEVEMRFTF